MATQQSPVAVVVTTTKMLSGSNVEIVRSSLAVEMITSACENYGVLALDLDSEPIFLNEIKTVGACVINQTSSGTMGAARREAFRAAKREFPDSDIFIWMEPEKSSMVQHLEKGVQAVEKGNDFAFFNRNSLASYPKEQAYAYSLVWQAAKHLLKKDLDFMFGPLVMSRKMIYYFTDYNGKSGDNWESIHVPKLRAIKDNRKYFVVKIDYKHPKKQTDIEKGDIELFMKRIEQTHCVTAAMCKEWHRD